MVFLPDTGRWVIECKRAARAPKGRITCFRGKRGRLGLPTVRGYFSRIATTCDVLGRRARIRSHIRLPTDRISGGRSHERPTKPGLQVYGVLLRWRFHFRIIIPRLTVWFQYAFVDDWYVPRSNIYQNLFRPFRLAIYLVTGNGASLRWRCGQGQAAVSRGGGSCRQCQAAVSLGGAALRAMPGSHFAGGGGAGFVARARCGLSRFSFLVLKCNFVWVNGK